MKMPKKRMLKFEHEKKMPGSPLITDVFGVAFSKIYGHGELEGVWFEFNGMTVVIQRSITRGVRAQNIETLRKAASKLVRSYRKYPPEYGDLDGEIKALKRALKDIA